MLVESGKLTDTNKRTFNMAGNIHAKVFVPAINIATPTSRQPTGSQSKQPTPNNLVKPMTGLVKHEPIPEPNKSNQMQPWDFDQDTRMDELTAAEINQNNDN